MNREIVQRLSQYNSVLNKFKGMGLVKIFSDNLGDALGISASLVRKDFMSVGITGNKRGGYQVEKLIEALNTILGKDKIQRVIIIGCGKIGTALMNYNGFSRERIKVVAGFDLNHDIISSDAPTPIYDVSELSAFIQREKIEIAIITVPENATAQIIDMLIKSGIKGVLNFAPVQLKGNDKCTIRNINIALEVENLFSFVHFLGKQGTVTG